MSSSPITIIGKVDVRAHERVKLPSWWCMYVTRVNYSTEVPVDTVYHSKDPRVINHRYNVTQGKAVLQLLHVRQVQMQYHIQIYVPDIANEVDSENSSFEVEIIMYEDMYIIHTCT